MQTLKNFITSFTGIGKLEFEKWSTDPYLDQCFFCCLFGMESKTGEVESILWKPESKVLKVESISGKTESKWAKRKNVRYGRF